MFDFERTSIFKYLRKVSYLYNSHNAAYFKQFVRLIDAVLQ